MAHGVSGRVAGAVLTGGRSTRMGRDKTLLEVEGTPLAARATSALHGAGVAEVRCIGGDLTALTAMGLDATPDLHPRQGPLGGILTACATFADHDVIVVLAGDLATPSSDAIRTTLAALVDDADVAVPLVGGRPQWLHAAWRRDVAERALGWAFDQGERAVHRAVGGLRVHRFEGLTREVTLDIDTPADLRSADSTRGGELP